MRKLIGIFCISLGIACLMFALGFILYNQYEAKNAEKDSRELLGELQKTINKNKSDNQENDIGESTDLTQDSVTPNNIKKDMTTVKVDGYDCIGILSIPVLEIELPVLSEWSYAKLKKAPCHYYGSYYEKDFVIAAHNYTSHFGKLSRLKVEDIVIFTGADGISRYYEVILLETLPQNATEEMITSGFDLSLYTCTLGGNNRVTVRCNLIDINK